MIVDLNHPFVGVKEQRVDGSSDFRNLESVRCTLVAGKPVFERKIHINSRTSLCSLKSTLDP